MKLITVLATISILINGCAPNRFSDSSGFDAYGAWASQPTPDIWSVGSIWGLMLLDQDGEIERSLTVRFTDREAVSCMSGNWKQVDLIAERPPRDPRFLGKPAYWLDGSFLMIDLTANLCDNYHPLRGKLTDTGVAGTHRSEGMFHSEHLGAFYGAPVDK